DAFGRLTLPKTQHHVPKPRAVKTGNAPPHEVRGARALQQLYDRPNELLGGLATSLLGSERPGAAPIPAPVAFDERIEELALLVRKNPATPERVERQQAGALVLGMRETNDADLASSIGQSDRSRLAADPALVATEALGTHPGIREDADIRTA